MLPTGKGFFGVYNVDSFLDTVAIRKYIFG